MSQFLLEIECEAVKCDAIYEREFSIDINKYYNVNLKSVCPKCGHKQMNPISRKRNSKDEDASAKIQPRRD